MSITAAYDLVAIGRLHESPLNPRKHFDPKGLDELAASIKAKGILTPLLVRPNDDGFEIAAGHRRYRAAKMAKLAELPIIARDMTDAEFLEILTIENLQREDVHPLEEADGYRQLMEKAGYDVESIAAKIGKSPSYVYQRLELRKLADPARALFLEDKITAGHATLIARLQPKDQAATVKELFVDTFIEDRGGRERNVKTPIGVRALATWIENNVHLSLAKAAFPKDDAELVTAAGPCTTCPKRSGSNPLLFADIREKDVCTDPGCFKTKRKAFIGRQAADFGVSGKPVYVTAEHYTSGVLDQEFGGDVKLGGTWKRAKPESCKYVVAAVIAYGKGEGEAFTACTTTTCKTHFEAAERPGGRGYSGDTSYSRQQRQAQQKSKDEGASRRAILNAIREKVTGEPLPRKVLELIARGFWGDVWSEVQTALTRLFGWTDDKSARRERSDILQEKLPELTAKELNEVLVALAVGKELHHSPYGGNKHDILDTMTKLYKVDATRVRADAKSAKEKKPAKPKGAAKTPTPKKKAKK